MGINVYFVHRYSGSIKDSYQAWKKLQVKLGRDIKCKFVKMSSLPKSENGYMRIVVRLCG